VSKFLSLAIGTLTGGFSRYWLATGIYQITGAQFPHGTLAVNLSGCLAMGLLNGLSESKLLLSPETRLLLMTGFCGAFTTFSTFMLETSNLLKNGEALRALANVTVSLLAGFILFRLGEWAASSI
jgi:fluoride exporter